MAPKREPDVGAICHAAEELARKRRQPVTTIHLLAALAGHGGFAAELLAERRLDAEALLGLARADDRAEALPGVARRAKEIALRMGARQPGPLHLLMAVLNDARAAGRRALSDSAVDAGRLRTAAMTLGLGLVSRRPSVEQQARMEVAAAVDPPKGVAIPFFPPPDRLHVPKKRKPPAEAVKMLEPPPAPERDVAASAEEPVFEREPQQARSNVASPGVGGTATDARFAIDPRRSPVLAELGNNLMLAAVRGQLDPVFGREAEVEQVLDVLAKRHGNNPILVGAAGVGKTSIVRGIAQRIAQAHDVRSLDDRVVVEIPMTELFAGTGVRGALAARFGALRKEVAQARGRVVLFFDEIHQLLVGEAAEEIGAELKLALSRGELPCIGATTTEEYRRSVESDPALARRFTPVEVEEPSREQAYLILESVAGHYARHHRVRYDEAALALGVSWSVRYLPGRALPDKAVSIIDLAGARARRRGQELVSVEGVAEVVAGMADVPIERLLESDTERLLRLEAILAERVVGHQAHISRISRILRRNAAGLGAQKPIGTFLLLGPTGVGKTETAKAVAEALFHDETAMTRIDMSEYCEAHAVARLIGAPPGYVGHESGGQLTEALRRRPYQVVLLDEIEKAHPDVLTAFLAVFDEGRMTDGRGKTVDFTNAAIMMTSNLGAEHAGARARRRVGFGNEADSECDELEQRVTGAAKSALAPELYNRIDEVLVFRPLARADVRLVARRLLERLSRELERQRGIRLEVDEASLEFLLDHGGFEPEFGARPMRRALSRWVEAPLAERLLRGEFERGDVVLLAVDGDALGFDAVAATPGESAAE